MKKRIFTAFIALILIGIIVCSSVLIVLPNNIAEAKTQIEIYLFIEDIFHPLPEAYAIVSNTKVGLYVNPYKLNDGSMYIYVMSIDNKVVYEVKDNITYFPVIDGVTYTISIFSKTALLELPVKYITYDLQKPYITAETENEIIYSNMTVIGSPITIKGCDKLTGITLFMSKDGAPTRQCNGVTYEITEDGIYNFYAIDYAGNYSENFTITYYKQEPVKEPDEPVEPDPPITPTNPITPEVPIMDSENTTSQDGGIIAIVVIVSIVIVGIVAVIIYRKIKAKSTRFEEDE